MIKIRKATKKDVQQIIKIIRLNNPKYSKNLVLKEINEMFSRSLIKPTYFVLEKDREIIAFNGFSPSWVDNCVINLFWVNTHPNHKGKGFQIKLLKESIKQIKQIKNPKAKLILISTKIPSFFKKFGFIKITSPYDKDYILMEKRLT